MFNIWDKSSYALILFVSIWLNAYIMKAQVDSNPIQSIDVLSWYQIKPDSQSHERIHEHN